jgi:hypothetical protein
MARRRLQKELEEVRCSWDTRLVDDNLFCWHIRGLRGGCIEIRFPKDYPFKPPCIATIPNDDGEEVPLCKMLGFDRSLIKNSHGGLIHSRWSPTLTVARLLTEPVEPCNAFGSFLDALQIPNKDALLVSIGCGGSVMRQKYPPIMQAAFKGGKSCFLLLIDPHLLLTSSRLAVVSGNNFTIMFQQRTLTKLDVPPLQRIIRAFREQGGEVHVRDHRGASFRGALYPITARLDCLTSPAPGKLRSGGFQQEDRCVMTITEPSQTCVCVRRACACCRQCILTIVSSASGIIELDEIVHKILEMTITKPNEMGEDVLNHAEEVGLSINRVSAEERRRRQVGSVSASQGRLDLTPSEAPMCSESDRKIVELDGGLTLATSRRFEPEVQWCECDPLPG